MTITDERKPEWKKWTANLTWHKIILYMTVSTTFIALIFVATQTVIHTGIVVALTFAAILIMFIHSCLFGISTNKKMVALLFVSIGTFVMAISNNYITSTAFIQLIKTDHPPLVYIVGGCGNKKEEVLGAYKLIKINGTYSVKSNDKSYSPSDLQIYNYEEF